MLLAMNEVTEMVSTLKSTQTELQTSLTFIAVLKT